MAPPGLWAYRKNNPSAGLYVPLLAWWVILQPFAWRFEANPVYLVAAMGAVPAPGGRGTPRVQPFAIPYSCCGEVF